MKDLNNALEEVLIAWAADYKNRRIAYLRARKIESSGDLIDGFAYEATKPDGSVITLNIKFDDHGRIIDMKPQSITYDKWGRNAIDRLRGWVERRGVEKFVPGQLKARGRIPSDKATFLNNVAWGIMVNRSKGNLRRRAWYAKSTTASVTDLYNQVALTMLDTSSDNISEQLKQ